MEKRTKMTSKDIQWHTSTDDEVNVQAEAEEPHESSRMRPQDHCIEARAGFVSQKANSGEGEAWDKATGAKCDQAPRHLENIMNHLSNLERPPSNFTEDPQSRADTARTPPSKAGGPQAKAAPSRGAQQRVAGSAETEARKLSQSGSETPRDGAVSSQAKPAMSWSEWAAAMYSWTWKPLIRPPRELYNLSDLGRMNFVFRGRAFARTDHSILNSKGQRLSCSHFRQVKQGQAIPQHCIVYLHGSSSSRLEAFDVLPVLLPVGLSVFCLDLSGSGQSDGEFISLGYHEEQDLRAALAHLRSLDSVRSVGIWGRSMGATAAVMRAAEDNALAACVLDSPFTDLRMAIVEYIQNSQVRLPGFAIDAVIQLARSEVKSRAGFDIFDVAALKFAEKATCPALFAVAADDSFVLPHHTQELHNKWGGERQLRFFDGGHNGRRPKWFLDEAAEYLAQKMEEWTCPKEASEQQQRDAEEARRRTYWL